MSSKHTPHGGLIREQQGVSKAEAAQLQKEQARKYRMEEAAPEMLALIRDVAAKDHGHTMSNPKSLCLFCHARALLARIDGGE